MTYLERINEVQLLLQDDDHFDVKSIEAEVTLREFIAGALSYHPTWMKSLYVIRSVFVRFLGMKQEMIHTSKLTPQNLSFLEGDWTGFFQVHSAKENEYWIATASDKHLDAYIIVAQETLENGNSRFHVGTIVHYKNWAGPLYFNVIRPFHHIVVHQMVKAGANYQASQGDLTYA